MLNVRRIIRKSTDSSMKELPVLLSSIKQESEVREGERHEIETVQEEEINSPMIHDNNISSLKELSPLE